MKQIFDFSVVELSQICFLTLTECLKTLTVLVYKLPKNQVSELFDLRPDLLLHSLSLVITQGAQVHCELAFHLISNLAANSTKEVSAILKQNSLFNKIMNDRGCFNKDMNTRTEAYWVISNILIYKDEPEVKAGLLDKLCDSA